MYTWVLAQKMAGPGHWRESDGVSGETQRRSCPPSAGVNLEGHAVPGTLSHLWGLVNQVRAHQSGSSFLKSFSSNFNLQLPQSQGKEVELDSLRMNFIVAVHVFFFFFLTEEATRLNDKCKRCP